MTLDQLPVEVLTEFAAYILVLDYGSLASFCLTSRTIYPIAMRALYRKIRFEVKHLESSLHCASTLLTNDLAASFVGEIIFSLKVPIYSMSALRANDLSEEQVFTTGKVTRLLERTPNLIALVMQPAILYTVDFFQKNDTVEVDASRELTKEIFSDCRTRFQFSLTAFSTSLYMDPYLAEFVSTHPRLTTFSTLFPIVPGTGISHAGFISPDFTPMPSTVDKGVMPNLTLLCSFSHLAPFTFHILELLAPNRPLRAVFIAVPFWSHPLFKDRVPGALSHLTQIPTLRYLSFMGYLADFICIMQSFVNAEDRSPFLALQFLVYDDMKTMDESEMARLLTLIYSLPTVRFVAFYEVGMTTPALHRLFSHVGVNPKTMFIFTDTYGEIGAQGPGFLVRKPVSTDGRGSEGLNVVGVSSDTIEEIRRLSYQPTNEDMYVRCLERLSIYHEL